MNGFLTAYINYEEGSCLIVHTDGGQYDNILQVTEEAYLIVWGLSYGVDALYYMVMSDADIQKDYVHTYYRQDGSLGSLK